MIVLGALLGFVVGLSLGILGGGGSVLTVPIFVYVLGIETKAAIAMSLFVVGLTSLSGAAAHWRHGNVDLRVGALFGLFAMGGTFGGARLAIQMSGTAQLTLFAVVMLLAAVFMFRRSTAVEPPPGVRIGPGRALLIALQGIGVGTLTGLVGVGGGFLIVPALVLLAGVSMKQAVGTSLLIIAANCVSGFIGYLDQVQVRWVLMLVYSGIATTGILVGSRIVRHIPAAALRRGFAVFLMIMGLLILYQNRALLMEL